MKQLYLSLILLCGFVCAAIGQKTITGQVLNDAGDPMIGASIVIKGTTSGTITDFDGNYTLEVPSDASVLVVSYKGYGTQELNIGASDKVDATMSESSELWQDVKTGLGKETGDNTIKISTDDPDKQPLYIVDGVIFNPVSNDNEDSVSPDSDKSELLSTLDPDDIKEISVLKGASAHSIYGDAARNGVVIITTKSGKGKVAPE